MQVLKKNFVGLHALKNIFLNTIEKVHQKELANVADDNDVASQNCKYLKLKKAKNDTKADGIHRA